MRTLIFTFLSLICLSANAIKMTDLYSVNIPLNDTTKETLFQAQSDALSEVFIRASGQKSILQNEEVQKALKSANRYVTGEMQYKKGNDLFLSVNFSDEEVAKTLSIAKSTLWGSNRPQVIIWQVTSNGSKKIEWDQKPNQFTQTIKQQAECRGLPVLLPIGDLEDINGVSESDIWGGFTAPIIRASERYTPDSLLVIKLESKGSKRVVQEKESEQQQALNKDVPPLLLAPEQVVKQVPIYRLSWQFYDQSPMNLMQDATSLIKPQQGQFNGTLTQIYQQLFDVIADGYALRYAISLSGQSISSIDLRVENVKTNAAYYKLERILNTMSSVKSFYPTYSDGEVMEIKVALKTSIKNFMNELSLSSQLAQVNDIPLIDNINPKYTHLRLK